MAKTNGVDIPRHAFDTPFAPNCQASVARPVACHNLRNALGICVALIHVARIKKAASLNLAQSRHVRTPLRWTYERL